MIDPKDEPSELHYWLAIDPDKRCHFDLRPYDAAGDIYTFNDARFLIPRDGLTDLSKHWLIVQMETITLDGEYATGSPGYSYAHSRRTIFSNSDTTATPLVQQLLATKKCPGCNLQNANLNDSILVGASLSQSNLEGAKLLGASLQNANLYKANLKRVYLRSSNLKGTLCKMTSADRRVGVLENLRFLV
ncbi:pentapeptide repeat-containing protein [Microcoleus sp. FACHB-SPT15]|uniref:pentapeptide repeat-containing protein n=1 Tax=Microcoleus sp. FACHB-SPT15 TaxID=2692830 RepID=UPI0017804CB4|nr:pentapeptide repeat-containing protein [Microcoleus sp. FACHB-SPT15]MBD1808608.1 pentapeptide repeat-containing protein [Microcoleus sp. FACHB-SPT15]